MKPVKAIASTKFKVRVHNYLTQWFYPKGDEKGNEYMSIFYLEKSSWTA